MLIDEMELQKRGGKAIQGITKIISNRQEEMIRHNCEKKGQ